MHFRYSYIIPWLLNLLVFTQGLYAQPPAWQEYYLIRDRLPPVINCLTRNHEGYLYIGSTAGLHRFDGSRFVPVPFPNKNIADTVTALYEDNNLQLWLGFQNGKIGRVINGVIQYYDVAGKLPSQRVTSILSNTAGVVFISTNGDGIHYIINNRIHSINEKNGLSDPYVRSFSIASNGDLLAATDQGLNIISLRDTTARVRVLGPRQGLPDYMVTRIIPEGNDRYWLGTEEKGICLYDHRQEKITVPVTMSGWNAGRVYSLLMLNGNVWISAEDSLLRHDIRSGKTEGIEGSSRYKIRQKVADDQGNIWAIVSDGRLIRIPGNFISYIPFPRDVEFDHLHTLMSSRNGTLWMNNKWNQLVRLSMGPAAALQSKIVIPGLNENTDITSLYEDQFGNVWIGTMGKGVFIHDPSTGKTIPFSPAIMPVNSSILSISGKKNQVFISCLEGPLRVELPQTNDPRLFNLSCVAYERSLTGSDYVYEIFRDSRDRTWFATDGNGITMERSGKFTNFGKENGFISDDRVYSVTEDLNGFIWFSTRNSGLYRFDGKQFSNFSLDQGLSDLNISAVNTDKSGNIVVIHRKGLDIIDPKSLRVSYLNSNQGISQLNVEDLGAVTRDTAGNILVAAINGIMIYSAHASVMDQPRTMIENIFVFDRRLTDSSHRVFSHDENTFTFDFTGLYFADPGKVFFSYKLEGLDTSWYVTYDRRKHFVKLPPGKYVFRVRSSLNRNFSNASEASFSFVIRSPFYREPWFIILILLVVFGGIFYYIRRREQILQKIQKIRQERVRYQFEILRNQVNPHFLFNNFNTLISIIEDDPRMAVEYVEKLSDFFRMIVNFRDKDVISLREEMNLLENYYFLQRKRHGDNLKLELNISEQESLTYMIPPLTLQLLLENAIKHNVVSADIPLKVIVGFSSPGELMVSNSINPRSGKQPGAGLGLQNIVSRFRLLTNKEVDIINDGKNFVVSLPLISRQDA